MKRIPPQEQEVLRIGSSSIELQFRYFQGKSDGYIIFYVPSLKVTGYGNSDEEAIKSLKVGLDAFCEDVYDMKPKERKDYLVELGWNQHRRKNKKFLYAYIDKEGILQNFDTPKEVKEEMMEIS